MIKCYKCGNLEKFNEVHIGGKRKHEWEQQTNGRFVFNRSNYDEVHDTHFECALCGTSLNNQYDKFIKALYDVYDFDKYGD